MGNKTIRKPEKKKPAKKQPKPAPQSKSREDVNQLTFRTIQGTTEKG
jgi:hypothetical protein